MQVCAQNKKNIKKIKYSSRLVNSDQNAGSTPTEVEFQMKIPETMDYKDLHAGMIGQIHRVTTDNIHTYMTLHAAKWSDKLTCMYEER